MNEKFAANLNVRNDIAEEADIDSVLTAKELLEDLEKQGAVIYVSGNGTPWIQTEVISMTRFPIFNLEEPGERELSEIVSLKKIFLASYVVKPTDKFPANAVLYICSAEKYSPDKLSSSLLRNIRRAQKDLTMKEIYSEDFLRDGLTAFCDTRARVGLSDGTEVHFRKKFSKLKEFKTYKIWGAYIGEILIAYAVVNQTSTWGEISLYSSDQYLKHHPNDFLIYNLLEYYLIGRRIKFMSYGLSSIQLNTNKEGLHQFKVKFQFEPIPVHRKFYIRKRLSFLKSSIIKKVIALLLKLNPANRWLKKLEGVLELLH